MEAEEKQLVEKMMLKEEDIWLLASAAENLRGGSQNEEARVEAAWRIAVKLDELRTRITEMVDDQKAVREVKG